LQKKDFNEPAYAIWWCGYKLPFKKSTISHFALSDGLTTIIGKATKTSSYSFLGVYEWYRYFWVMLDTKVPHLADGISFLKHKKPYIVRNSGGLKAVGVVLRVLNFHFIPKIY